MGGGRAGDAERFSQSAPPVSNNPRQIGCNQKYFSG